VYFVSASGARACAASMDVVSSYVIVSVLTADPSPGRPCVVIDV
jgi:hypothetical protein